MARGTVDLPAFYIGRYEVTVAQFAAFVTASGFGVADRTLLGPADHPVADVSWPDALTYCRWLDATLSASPETPPVLRRLLADGWHVTLPSEAQWEKAARGPDGACTPGAASRHRTAPTTGGQVRPQSAATPAPIVSTLCST